MLNHAINQNMSETQIQEKRQQARTCVTTFLNGLQMETIFIKILQIDEQQVGKAINGAVITDQFVMDLLSFLNQIEQDFKKCAEQNDLVPFLVNANLLLTTLYKNGLFPQNSEPQVFSTEPYIVSLAQNLIAAGFECMASHGNWPAPMDWATDMGFPQLQALLHQQNARLYPNLFANTHHSLPQFENHKKRTTNSDDIDDEMVNDTNNKNIKRLQLTPASRVDDGS